jgi:fatty-acyl-CoA synthase
VSRQPVDFVAFHAARQPARLAACDLASGLSWTYRDLSGAASCCVSVLRGRGIGGGDRVAALARNSFHLLVLHLACSRLGAIYVPLNWRLASVELAEIIADASPRLLVFDGTTGALVVSAADGTPTLTMNELAVAIEAAAPAEVEEPNSERPSILLYTSGTSGRSKGVILSESNAYFTGENFARSADVAKDCVLLCDVPMFHVMGLVIGLRAVLQQGGAILLSNGFDPFATNQRIGDPSLGVTHYICLPQMAAALRTASNFDRRVVSRLGCLIVGGAPMDVGNVLAWLDDGVTVANGYGMTEIGAGAGMPLDPSIIRRRPSSTGLFPPTQEVRIVSSDGSDVSSGEAGEIWVRGPNVSKGYWNRPAETQQSFTADGWFKTGDIGAIDSEGYLTLIDRKKDMFISGGENVYPAEVEKVLIACPGVAEAAVMGVPDTRWGEVGVACLVLRPGATLTHEDLRAHCSEWLAGYKTPKQFVLAERLPRGGSGKVLKHVLKRILDEGRLQSLA